MFGYKARKHVLQLYLHGLDLVSLYITNDRMKILFPQLSEPQGVMFAWFILSYCPVLKRFDSVQHFMTVIVP